MESCLHDQGLFSSDFSKWNDVNFLVGFANGLVGKPLLDADNNNTDENFIAKCISLTALKYVFIK